MRVLPRLAGGAIVAATALTLTACGGHKAPSGPPSIGNVRMMTNMTNASFPLDAYMVSSHERITIENAAAIVAGRCMRRFGFDWQTPKIPDLAVSPYARRYAVTDPEEARRLGYHPPLTPGTHDKADPSHQNPPPGATAVYFGKGQNVAKGAAVPEGGCLGEARTKLGADPRTEATLADKLRLNAFQNAQTDSRTQAAFRKWSECMEVAGYHYATPWAANDDPMWSGDKASRTEIATAVADATCKRKVNLVSIWFAVETAYQQRAIDQNAPALTEERDHWKAYLRNASQVLSGQ
jgi:hypothetical protein